MQPLFRDSAELNRPLIPFAMERIWGAYASAMQTRAVPYLQMLVQSFALIRVFISSSERNVRG